MNQKETEEIKNNCIDCGIQTDRLNNFKGRCGKCHAAYLKSSSSVQDLQAEKENKTRKKISLSQQRNKHLNVILTTETSHNLPVVSRLGIVTAEVVVGMNIFKDALTGVRNIVGGRTGNIQKALKDMRKEAFSELLM